MIRPQALRQLIVVAFCMSCGAAPVYAAGESFFEGFDTLDLSRWYVSDGWANGPTQNCAWTKSQISVSDGHLNVGFTKGQGADDRSYICGEIQTRTNYSYGTYEASYKTPGKASGLNAAFFTYVAPPKAPVHDEIDFEGLLKDPMKVQTGGFTSNEGIPLATPDLPVSSDADFIHYAFVWAPDSLKYYVNGKLVHSITNPAEVQKEAQRIYFSLWASDTLTDWMGPFSDPGPVKMLVDWVAYTAPSETCLFPQSLTCAQ